MHREVLATLYSLFRRKKRLGILLSLTLCLTLMTTNDSWSSEGFKLVPQIIGILLGGLLAAISIIFALIKDEELIRLYKRHGSSFFESLIKLKQHTIIIIVALFVSVLSFIIGMPFLFPIKIGIFEIKATQVFNFIEIFLLLLTGYLAIEVVLSLFLIFEIKLNTLTKLADHEEKTKIDQ